MNTVYLLFIAYDTFEVGTNEPIRELYFEGVFSTQGLAEQSIKNVLGFRVRKWKQDKQNPNYYSTRKDKNGMYFILRCERIDYTAGTSI